MKVKVVAYKDKLVMIPSNPAEGIGKTEGWYPTGDGRMGCVVLDTKNRLGVSEEAFELMKTIPNNNDDLGDIGWWECHDGTWAFAWFGSIHRVIDPTNSEGDREFKVTGLMKQVCTIIPNDVPEEAKAAIDAGINEGNAWQEPHLLNNVTLQGHEDDNDDDDHCGCGDEHCH